MTECPAVLDLARSMPPARPPHARRPRPRYGAMRRTRWLPGSRQPTTMATHGMAGCPAQAVDQRMLLAKSDLAERKQRESASSTTEARDAALAPSSPTATGRSRSWPRPRRSPASAAAPSLSAPPDLRPRRARGYPAPCRAAPCRPAPAPLTGLCAASQPPRPSPAVHAPPRPAARPPRRSPASAPRPGLRSSSVVWPAPPAHSRSRLWPRPARGACPARSTSTPILAFLAQPSRRAKAVVHKLVWLWRSLREKIPITGTTPVKEIESYLFASFAL
nr:vegetative cell wall protein gp1 [Aegilops tauschii subsp. strangulata]